MAGLQYLATLDLRRGYHQVKIKEEDVEKLTSQLLTG